MKQESTKTKITFYQAIWYCAIVGQSPSFSRYKSKMNVKLSKHDIAGNSIDFIHLDKITQV